MKFAHLSDCHIGGWREEELKKLSLESFKKAVEICVAENVGFVIIAGDLFNTALPNIDMVKEATAALRILKENNIDVYLVPGSHDLSPSGKTMLDILEKSGLVHNVFKFKDGKLEFTEDKTGVKLTGVWGMMGGLEKVYYKELKNLDELEKEPGFKIFVFHTLLEEFKPKELEMVKGESVASLPKGFNYYAGGHPHFVYQIKKEGYGLITYPGPLFPNNFKELEELKHGGFYIVDDKLNIKHIPVMIKEVKSFYFDADNKTPEEVEEEISSKLKKEDLADKIVTIRIEGTLRSGKPSDIKFKDVFVGVDAYHILKNTAKLTSKEFEETKVERGDIHEVERKVIKQNVGQFEFIPDKDKEEGLVVNLMNALDKEKFEAERAVDFEKRICDDVIKVLDLGGLFDESK